MECFVDDCLLRIFELLELKDQIAVAQVCERFQCLIQSQWRIKYRLLNLDFLEFQLTEQEFDVFVRNIHTTTEAVRFKFLTRDKCEVLKRYTFPKVMDLRYSQTRPLFMQNEDLLHLSRTFPNICTFSPQGNFSGKYLTNWQQLRQLTLTYIQRLEYSYFREIMNELQLHALLLDAFVGMEPVMDNDTRSFATLQKLVVNSDEVSFIVNPGDNLKYFTNLNELVLVDRYNPSSIADTYVKLLKYKSHNVYSIEVTNSNSIFQPTERNYSRRNQVESSSFISNITRLLELTNYFKDMYGLRQVIFFACYIVHDYNISLLLLSKKNIEYVDIESCCMNFCMVILNAEEIVENRTKLLKLNFYDNKHNFANTTSHDVRILIEGQSNLFELSSLKTDNINYDPVRFLMESQCAAEAVTTSAIE